MTCFIDRHRGSQEGSPDSGSVVGDARDERTPKMCDRRVDGVRVCCWLSGG
jgi:hypothetical protein